MSDNHSYIQEYNSLIQAGEIPACKRLLRVYDNLTSSINTKNCFLDPAKSRRAVEFIERFCKHSKGEWAGQPVRLELFQKAFIEAVFGVIDPATGLRQFRECFFLVGRKNGKSTLLAGIALYMMLADGEGCAEIYSTATKYAKADPGEAGDAKHRAARPARSARGRGLYLTRFTAW